MELGQIPTLIAVDEDGIYIAFGSQVYRYNLDGSSPAFLRATIGPPNCLFTYQNFLYICYDYMLFSLQKQTGQPIDSINYTQTQSDSAISPSSADLYSISQSFYPPQLQKIHLLSDGHFAVEQMVPLNYTGLRRVDVIPGEKRLIVNIGFIYFLEDRSLNFDLGVIYSDIAFYGDLPVLIVNGLPILYDQAFRPAVQINSTVSPQRIFIYGSTYTGFYGDTQGQIGFDQIDLSKITTLAPWEKVNPNGLVFTPDLIFVSIPSDPTIIYMYSRNFMSLFRFDLETEEYLPSIPLSGAAKWMDFNPSQQTFYIGYPSGKITRLSVRDAAFLEELFLFIPERIFAIKSANDTLVVNSGNQTWGNVRVYSPSGQLVSVRPSSYYTGPLTWVSRTRRLYGYSQMISPADLLYFQMDENGKVLLQKDSPYHGGLPIVSPLRANPEGTRVINGAGRIYDGTTLEEIAALPMTLTDAAWNLGRLITMDSLNNTTSRIHLWSPQLTIAKTVSLEGSPLAVFDQGFWMLAATSISGQPKFYFLDPDLNRLTAIPQNYYQHIPFITK